MLTTRVLLQYRFIRTSVWSLYFLHLLFFLYRGKILLRDCGFSWVTSFILLVQILNCKSALNPTVNYSTDRSKAVVPLLVLLFVALWFILRGDLF